MIIISFWQLWEQRGGVNRCFSCLLIQSSWTVWDCQRPSGPSEDWNQQPFCAEAMGSWRLLTFLPSVESPRPWVTLGWAVHRSSYSGAARQRAQTLWDSLQQTDPDACSSANTHKNNVTVFCSLEMLITCEIRFPRYDLQKDSSIQTLMI